MCAGVTITAKIPVEYKEKLKKHGINLNQLINKAIARELQRIDDEEYNRLLGEASTILQRIPDEHLVKLIRSSRDEH
jgi:hypothetical protein